MLAHKFRKNPDQYFEDSRHWLVRNTIRPIFRVFNRRNRIGILLEGDAFPCAGSGNGAIGKFVENRRSSRRKKLLNTHNYPKISVIIPAYNAEEFIETSINSLRDQNYQNIEIIVVDDHSTDSTWKILKKLASQDPRISVQATGRQRGAAYCRNLGLAVATGAFLTFHDADDLSAPMRLELQLCRLLPPGPVRVCLCNYTRVNQRGERLEINGETVHKCIISMMFDRQKILTNIGYFRHVKVGSDADFYERIKRFYGPKCETIVFKGLYQALFRTDSLTMANSQDLKIDGTKITYARNVKTEELWQELRREHKQIKTGDGAAFISFAR